MEAEYRAIVSLCRAFVGKERPGSSIPAAVDWNVVQRLLLEHGVAACLAPVLPRDLAPASVLAELDQRDHQRIHLIGHSMGGAVASLVTLMDPDRVASLTLLAPGGFGPDVNVDVLHDWAAADTAEAG